MGTRHDSQSATHPSGVSAYQWVNRSASQSGHPALASSAMSHRTPVKVRFYELDPYGHVNHAVYVQYFEVGRVDCLRAVGCSLETLLREGYQLVVAELHTRFLRPAGPEDELVVETALSELGRASSWWHQRILRSEEDGTESELCAQELRVAVTDLGGRLTRVPDHLAAALARLAA